MANSRKENEDVWDDTELIKMYEDSISSTYNALKPGKKTTTYKSENGKTYKWNIGSKCMAPFEEEGEVSYFKATVNGIADNETDITVTFDDYGNTEVVQVKDLWKADELNEPSSSKKQPSGKKNGGLAHMTASIPSMAPPPPPGLLAMVPPDEVEALSSMLMSWYMSGYHTGYYQAMTDQKKKTKK